MEIEKRTGTTNKYVTRTSRRDGRLQKRYIGKATDPVVQLFLESERLAHADELAYREACDREQEIDIAASKSLDWLCQWSSRWKVILLLREREMHSKPTVTTASGQKPPGLHKFTSTCRLAEKGDDDAQRQVDAWIAETSEILNDATDIMAIARDHLMRFVGSASAEDSLLWQKRIDMDISAILREAGDDPLTRMYAEVVVLAMLDVMRSSLMPYLAGGDMKRSTYWGKAMDHAQRRWTKITKAFQQYLKHLKKNPIRK